jgi:kinesin family protein 2/24
MIACVSPGFSSANHTINTLRYSDRLKEKTSMMKGNKHYQQHNVYANPTVQENNFMKVQNNFNKAAELLEALDVRNLI